MMDREAGFKLIAEYRDQIDELDREIVRLLNERTKIVEKLGRIKEELSLPVYEPKREDQVFENIVRCNHGPLPPDAIKRLFERIIDEMRTLQQVNRRDRKQANRDKPGGGQEE